MTRTPAAGPGVRRFRRAPGWLIAGTGHAPAVRARAPALRCARRYLGGSAPIASSSTARWSAAVLLPALPLRSIPASGSPLLSH